MGKITVAVFFFDSMKNEKNQEERIAMKNYEEFKSEIQKYLQERYASSGYEAKISRVEHMNGVSEELTLDGTPWEVVPGIDLLSLYKIYLLFDMDKCMEYLTGTFKKCEEQDLAGIVGTFAEQKERILPKLVNRKRNSRLLENLVSRPFLDLAIIIRVSLPCGKDGASAVILLSKEIMENVWKVSEEEVFQAAYRNQQKERVIGTTMQNLFEDDRIEEMIAIIRMKREETGASVLLRKDILQRIAREYQASFYILPSSVHEIVTVKAEGHEEEDLREMIPVVNQMCVKEAEQLSDYLYYFDADKNKVELRTDTKNEYMEELD